MLTMDLILSVCIGIVILISAALSLHKNNHYSRQTKILKFFPRFVLAVQFLLIPFLIDDIHITNSTDFYSLSDHVRVILWGTLILWSAEIVIQFLNIRFGRAEKE